ncbi:MAG TPA: DoxX family protein [Candidatus Acidoferrum sp.]|nr:DoxX family protein [Candidatus Acidoferrum sp.]
MANSSGSGVALIGRVLLSVIFIASGLSKVMAFSMMAGYVAAKGFPMPAVALGIAAAIEILGGLTILAGFQTKLASWILFVFLIPTTLAFHNFWAMQGMERMDNQGHFMKNLAIMGGLLLLAANGAGGYSVDSSKAKAT